MARDLETKEDAAKRDDNRRRVDEKFVRQLDWNLLYVFFVVGEERGVTKAATKLGITQPAVSNAIKRLERHVDKELLDRSQSGFSLTEAGDLLHVECCQIYSNVSSLPNALAINDTEVTGQIRLAVLTHVDCPIFDQTMSEFHSTYPRVSFEIWVATSGRVIDRVANNSATAGICLLEENSRNLEVEHLYRERFALFCGKDHRLAGRADLQLADLEGEDFVSFPTDRAAGPLRAFSQLREKHGVGGSLVGVSSNLEEVKRMIIAGLGIGPLPVHVVRGDVNADELWMLDIPDSMRDSDIFLVLNPKARLNRAETLFIEALRKKIAVTPLNQRTYPNNDV